MSTLLFNIGNKKSETRFHCLKNYINFNRENNWIGDMHLYGTLQLGRWEASIQDYEALLQETPEDEEVKKALSEAQAQLNTNR